MKFAANCLIVALAASIHPRHRFKTKRNRAGRLHFYWIDGTGSAWEFYKRGASGKTYLQNALYLGEIKRVA